eukprot:TRINITY_DN13402_c0_g1_i2.p1 TRINITY_DN13402_c0_g1~~TRINITY_DN13402_c0_g1_i2.p1  ORF type:complete len:482 (-),score=80.18 TRINITY_DN13402_c0_g1_i2:158-1603(-)
MAKIVPIKGLRANKNLVEKIIAPPYDVINSEEARVYAKGNECSFLHITKPEIDLDPSIDLYDDSVYQKAKENFDEFIKKEYLIRDKKASLYVYKLVWKNICQIGLVGGASVEDYENDIIKKHEKTRADKEDDRARHVETLSANTGPVFLTYREKASINKIMENEMSKTPTYDLETEDGIKHTFWVIEDQATIDTLVKEFAQIDYLYVADGHHRSASAARFGAKKRKENPAHNGKENYNYFLSVLFPSSQLYIMDYNRIVKDLNGLSEEEFLQKVAENFVVKEEKSAYKPEKLHTFGMCLSGKWYSLKAKENIIDNNDPINVLDTSILQDYLLAPVLAIGDPRKDKRIDFVGGIRGMAELEKRSKTIDKVAFSLFPTTLNQLMNIADAGKIMPPKSTWFEPKLRSGFIVNLIDQQLQCILLQKQKYLCFIFTKVSYSLQYFLQNYSYFGFILFINIQDKICKRDIKIEKYILMNKALQQKNM